MARKTGAQGKKKRILVLCDGESEITYSSLTVSAYNVNKNLVTVVKKPFKNLETMLAELGNRKPKKKEILKYEEIHLICDKEKLSNKSRQISYEKFIDEVNKIRKSFGSTTIKIVASFPTFEFFLSLHFPIKDKEFKKLHNDRELIELLSKQHQNYTKGSEKWLKDAIFNKHFEEKISLAIERASQIKPSDSNSWSDVFETVRQIINNSK
jgi:hypothetical protein